jgi:hypothetical protein
LEQWQNVTNMKERQQISVTLDRELRLALERAAAEQRRTLSNQAAYWIAQAIANQDGARVAA